jgi:pepF/M3 family oligoendopeptidase
MTTTTERPAAALPHWDMSVVYAGLDAPEFAAGFAALLADIEGLVAQFDAAGLDAAAGTAVDDATVALFERLIESWNRVLTANHQMIAYVQSFVATDSRNTTALGRMSELQAQGVRLQQLSTRFTAWVGAMDVEALIGRSTVARDHAFMLRQAKIRATHLMGAGEESLAAELSLTGSTAWGTLYGTFTSQLQVPVALPDGPQTLPMPAVRNLAYERDRAVRQAGFEAEIAAWTANAVPLAAALNGIQGEVLTLAARRRWESPLDLSLFRNNIDRATLDAMMTAARESFPDFRRYLRAKARLLGVPTLAFYDLFAPVGENTRVWEYGDATQFIVEQFGTFSPRLQTFAARAFEENWIDAEPRPGKRDGAFCMWLRNDESRIMANYKPAFPGLSTLAHELGHGYHNLNLAGRTYLQRSTPMTLAETASTFCETIIRRSSLAQADAQEGIAILEAALQATCQQVVDITSRFQFEQGAFELRRRRDVGVEEFKALMLESQRDTYGDGLDPNSLHPYMWAAKGHYYSPNSFYNYPYMFGLLFGLGLYARYEADPAGFRAGYDRLLSSTGLADAATLAADFGIDTRTPAFWQASLAVIRADIDRFEALVDGVKRET